MGFVYFFSLGVSQQLFLYVVRSKRAGKPHLYGWVRWSRYYEVLTYFGKLLYLDSPSEISVDFSPKKR